MKLVKNKIEKKDNSLYGKKNIEDNLSMLYHENSKFNKYTMRTQGEKILAFSNNKYIRDRAMLPYKLYPNSPVTNLNNLVKNDCSDFINVLTSRRSTRKFNSSYKIKIDEIAQLLYNSYGETGFPNEWNIKVRNVPSAGGLYPLDIYIVALNSTIDQGIYHYNILKNNLELLSKGDFRLELEDNIQAAPYVELENAGCVVICTGIIERLYIKYGQRAYRFMLQESGMITQNFSLISEHLGLGSCILGGYHDDNLNSLLKIDGVYETVLSVIAIGGKIKNEIK